MYNLMSNGSYYLSSQNAYTNKLPGKINVSSSNHSSNMSAWIGPAISAAGSIMSSLFGGLSAGKQYKYQRNLNAQQQQYARENAATEYERQMQLTQLNPLLQKNGMKSAGINPSFANGSAVAGASSVNGVAAPSAGAAPTVPNVSELFQTGANAVSTVLGSAGVLADNEVKKAQAQNIQTDTAIKDAELSVFYKQKIAEFEKMRAEARGENARAFYQELVNDLQKKFGESNAANENARIASEAKIAESNASVIGVRNEQEIKSLEADIKMKLASADLSVQERQNLLYQLYHVLPAQAENLRAGAQQSRANAKLAISQEKSVALDNAIKENPTVKDARVIQEVIKSAPTNVAQAVFSNPWYKRYIKACQTGRKLNYEEKWNFQRLCMQYSLIEKQGAAGTALDVILPTTSSVQDPTTIK